ncbi:hypothetical protein BDF14DRAFT_1716231 [Spinellus fusiger]|nr:hypothetical protein BDF14DRAFT_1716231 [Spinellus fusiger]
MMGTMASPLFDPEIESMLCTTFTLLSILLALFIIFFAFLTVRVDHITLWSWNVVWIPLWIIDAVGTMVTFQQVHRSLTQPDNEDDDDDDDKDDKDPQHTSTQTAQGKRAARRRMRFIRNLVYLISWLLFVVFQVFIVLRLDQRVAWSAVIVFAPYFALEGIHFLISIVSLVVTLLSLMRIASRHQEPINAQRVLGLLFSQYWFTVIRIAWFVLMALKIDNRITCSWAVVFIPIYLIGVKYAVELILSYRKYSLLPQPEVARQGKITTIVGAVAFSISLFICCTGCCLPCMLLVSSSTEMEDLEQQQQLVDHNRRITQSGEPSYVGSSMHS